MAWRNPHRQTISDLSAFPKHLLLSPALLELPHWLLVNYANKVMFEHIVSVFFCNCASLHSLPPSSRGTIRVTEHVSKIYASVTNYNALSLISPLLLLLRLHTGLVMCLPFGGGLRLWVLLSFFPAYQCVTSHLQRQEAATQASQHWSLIHYRRYKIYFGVSLFFFGVSLRLTDGPIGVGEKFYLRTSNDNHNLVDLHEVSKWQWIYTISADLF